jgi:hypothetical protein
MRRGETVHMLLATIVERKGMGRIELGSLERKTVTGDVKDGRYR